MTVTHQQNRLHVGRGDHSRTFSGEPHCKKHVFADKTLWRADEGVLCEAATTKAQHSTARAPALAFPSRKRSYTSCSLHCLFCTPLRES